MADQAGLLTLNMDDLWMTAYTEKYPNLTRAYMEAVGVIVAPDDEPISERERSKAVLDYHYFRSRDQEEQRQRNAILQQEAYDRANEARKEYLREQWSDSDKDSENSDDARENAAWDDEIENDRQDVLQFNRELDENSDYVAEEAAEEDKLMFIVNRPPPRFDPLVIDGVDDIDNFDE